MPGCRVNADKLAGEQLPLANSGMTTPHNYSYFLVVFYYILINIVGYPLDVSYYYM